MTLACPYPILSITSEFLSTALPCRLRHVEGQIVPKLQFQAEPFRIALKMLQHHQYGRKMLSYQLPENVFGARLSDAPSEPSDEERTIHNRMADLHTITRDNLLMFETVGFELPREATGEQHVNILVGFVSCYTVLFSTQFCVQLGQLNDIVRLCQRFDLMFDMSEADWPLLTVEFKLLRDHQIEGIYEVSRNSLTVSPSY